MNRMFTVCILTHLEIGFAHVLVLLHIKPKVKGILGRFTLQENLS
jgi:hypothetical protein